MIEDCDVNAVDSTFDLVADLRSRVALLENELTETKVKLSSTQQVVASLENRCATAEASCEELRRQIGVFQSLLDGLVTVHASSCGVPGNQNHLMVQKEKASSASSLEAGDGSAVIVDVNMEQNDWTSQQPDLDATQVESIADHVRAVAESAVVESNFVFDSQTGLYYDYVTGYYYDAEKSLYYEPQSGRYFYFDDASRDYKYHSRVDSVKHKMLTHIIFGRAGSASAEKKSNRKSKRLQKSSAVPDEQQIKRQGQKVADSIREQNEVQQLGVSYVSLKAQHELHSAVSQDMSKSSSSLSRINPLPDEDTLDVVVSDDNSSVELEDGELDSDSAESSAEDSVVEETVVVMPQEIQNCTPCIRAMVVRSDYLTVGSLFIITCTGGTIGRQSDLGHSIVIPDPLVSKMQCSVEYDADRQRYTVKDHASQVGTFVNNCRLSKAKTISEPKVVYHGDTLRLAGTTFELHIHPRMETCDKCEPGCLQSRSDGNDKANVTREDKERERRTQLKQLKKKFGLSSTNYVDRPSVKCSGSGVKYQDRASERRRTVGSDVPVEMRVEPASVHRPIASTNVGHKMLAKMGWKEGESLGGANRLDAIREPINVELRLKPNAGLGAYAGTQHSLDDVSQVPSKARWLHAQDRYAKLTNSNALSSEAVERDQDISKNSIIAHSTVVEPRRWVKSRDDS